MSRPNVLLARRILRKRSEYVITAAVLLDIYAAALRYGKLDPTHAWISVPLAMLASTISIIGACMYARSKKYSPWIGLFGALVFGGYLVLLLLPDRYELERG